MPIGLNNDTRQGGGETRQGGGQGEGRLAAEISAVFTPASARLDDRTRSAIEQRLTDLVALVEITLRRQAARLLAVRGRDAAAEGVVAGHGSAFERLARAGLLRDPDLMADVIAAVRGDLIADALPSAGEGEGPGLLLRLAGVPDRAIATAARALLDGDQRGGDRADLSADLYYRLLWWIAAAIGEDDPAAAPVLAEAAYHCLADHDEGERPLALAARLALAIDALPAEVPDLLGQALGDRRLWLFIAILARGLGVEIDVARALVLEPDGEWLWMALRAVGLDASAVARVALSLTQADPRRDLEAFVDRLDAIAAVPEQEARAAARL